MPTHDRGLAHSEAYGSVLRGQRPAKVPFGGIAIASKAPFDPISQGDRPLNETIVIMIPNEPSVRELLIRTLHFGEKGKGNKKQGRCLGTVEGLSQSNNDTHVPVTSGPRAGVTLSH